MGLLSLRWPRTGARRRPCSGADGQTVEAPWRRREHKGRKAPMSAVGERKLEAVKVKLREAFGRKRADVSLNRRQPSFGLALGNSN